MNSREEGKFLCNILEEFQGGCKVTVNWAFNLSSLRSTMFFNNHLVCAIEKTHSSITLYQWRHFLGYLNY